MNNVKRSAWLCPSCQSMHAPHCDTCPNQADAVATKVMPQVFPRFNDDYLRWTAGERMPELPISICAA